MILENMKDEIYKKKKKISNREIRTTDVTTKKYNAYNRSATLKFVKHITKQGIWKAANIFPSINAVFSSISK